jgi:hypothetical protein
LLAADKPDFCTQLFNLAKFARFSKGWWVMKKPAIPFFRISYKRGAIQKKEE